LHLPVKVTPRIMPGVVSFPQGAWYKPVGNVDEGGNINTLTSQRPSPLAKANPSHTNLVEVLKA
jgi:anaerobic selenocysteine-containing dehydrogenase